MFTYVDDWHVSVAKKEIIHFLINSSNEVKTCFISSERCDIVL